MNYRHLAIAALLFGTGWGMGWSTNIAYEVQTGKTLWRGLASDSAKNIKREITIENLKEHMDAMDERADEIVTLHDSITEGLKENNLSNLIAIRDKKLPQLKKFITEHEKDHELFKTFMDRKIQHHEQDRIIRDVKRIAGILGKVEDIKLEVISGQINDHMRLSLEKKALAQDQTITELNQNICRQNRELSSLTTKIEDLIKKQESVFKEVEKEERIKADQENAPQILAMDPNLLLQAFSSPYQMPAQQFFGMPQDSGLVGQSNPFGIDMNFLMMTKMLTGSSGFGPRASVNYAPVYNQQRTYYGMPQTMMNPPQSMPFAQQQEQLPNQGALFPGFNFTRGNGDAGEIPLGM